jgi:hypothetical protein
MAAAAMQVIADIGAVANVGEFLHLLVERADGAP